MSRVKISVTQDDINSGVRNACLDCPIALAIKRAGHIAKVGSEVVYLPPNVRRAFRPTSLPRSAQRFIRRFDQAKPVEPFNFFLEMTV